jgi:RHS repeat-associated protein
MPVATDFVLAGGEEIADYYESSASWRLTVRGAGGLPLVTVVPAAGGGSEEIVYVHHDVKGSTVALTEAGSNGPAEIYTYSDYGQPQSGTWLAYQYAGYRYDSETGLYYTPARSYSPVLGRFLQSDPVGFHGGLNMYAYAGNDPFNLVDPTGLTPDGGEKITAEASATLNNYLMEVLGIPTVNVSATASAPCRCTPTPASAAQYAAADYEIKLLTAQFFSGLGPSGQVFQTDSAVSAVMAQSAQVQNVLNEYYMTGKTRDWQDFGAVGYATAGLNPVAQFLGSFGWTITPGNGGIYLQLTNRTSFRSLTADKGPLWPRFPIVTQYGTFTSPMGNTNQTINIFVPCS